MWDAGWREGNAYGERCGGAGGGTQCSEEGVKVRAEIDFEFLVFYRQFSEDAIPVSDHESGFANLASIKLSRSISDPLLLKNVQKRV